MQVYKNSTQGIKKNDKASTDEKEFDLDRKRDDDRLLDSDSLEGAEYQASKKVIQKFDTQVINLLWNIDTSKTIQTWTQDGELELELFKAVENKYKYWPSLE